MDDQAIASRLADEFESLMADPLTSVQFSAEPFEAYTVVAALQGASRHPGMTDAQRRIVLGLARQVADRLIEEARQVIGPCSTIETTLEMGFDARYDVELDQRE